jgi:acyl carrier protein
MTHSDIEAAIIAAVRRVAPEIDAASIRPGVSFRDELDLDSMDFLNFVLALHDRLGVEIPEIDYPKLYTFDSAAACLAHISRIAAPISAGAGPSFPATARSTMSSMDRMPARWPGAATTGNRRTRASAICLSAAPISSCDAHVRTCGLIALVHRNVGRVPLPGRRRHRDVPVRDDAGHPAVRVKNGQRAEPSLQHQTRGRSDVRITGA